MKAVRRVWRLLWTRRILSVGAAYLLVAAVLVPAALILEQGLGLPDWVGAAAIGVILMGFIPALALAWTSSADRSSAASEPTLIANARHTAAFIAVLPFVNLSREEADEIFADGMVEDLITGLCLNSTLTVVSRSSTFAYKGQSPDVREVAADLGVGFVLEGSVRRTGERLRVTVQLVDAQGGSVWAEKYDRHVAELFDLQDDLVCEIAAALGDAVVRAELQRIRRNPSSVTAWEESMRALIAQERPSLATVPSAVKHARKAVELDPTFSLGRARLAMSLITHAQLIGGEDALPLRQEGELHMDRALLQSPNDHKILGIACGAYAHIGRADEAIQCGERALELNPHDAPIEGSLGTAYFRAGRFAEAVPHYEAEERLSPRSPFLASRCTFHALTRIMLDQLDRAQAVLERGLEMDPAFESAWAALAMTRMMRGDEPGAIQAMRTLRGLTPMIPLEIWRHVINANMPAAAVERGQAAFEAAWAAAERNVAA